MIKKSVFPIMCLELVFYHRPKPFSESGKAGVLLRGEDRAEVD